MKEKWDNGEWEDNKIKAIKAFREKITSMTKEERIEKYGHLNKLSVEDREKFINEVLLCQGCHAWWKNASDKEKRKVRDKAAQTRLEVANLIVEAFSRGDMDFEKFYKVPKHIRERNREKRNAKRRNPDGTHKIPEWDEASYKFLCNVLDIDENTWEEFNK